ncbi:DUF1868 domain-containing protein [Pontivivens ytuae]|uniref:DUF1868 domain-containing protein n=1 Tax=Pontivivens ytuae TaxID=2789856 RepID=A0A7S9LQS5_9RHOB|nr:DUF1868 domain-containing protein [Pontivivens ytuae]QPH53581.1 DUF1868 domain-containing protein [Pontivivens ytuae]
MSDRLDPAYARDYLTGRLTGGPRPAAVGRKFSADGAVLPAPGNTFLCHVDPASDAHAALARAQDILKAGPLADAFTFLPPASFHMTVFQGVIATERDLERWPGHLATDAAIDDVTTDIEPRVASLTLPTAFQIRPLGIFGGFSVSVSGADAEQEDRLRRTRDTLSDAIGLRAPDHDSYDFHITLGYLLRWLSPEDAETVLDTSRRAAEELPEQITLGPVEFCTFDDMHRFAPVRQLMS